jgi:hypothetical protein
MIAGIFHEGSGIGNQLHRFVMTRVLALDKGLEWGMINTHNFKAKDFMSIDFQDFVVDFNPAKYEEKKEINEFGNDVRDYDWPGVLRVRDNTIIDGEFQGEKYFEHHLDEIREWLKVEPLDMPDDLCVIAHRGGEYVGVKDLYLPFEYWDMAIIHMRIKYPKIRFEVQTDDPVSAKRMFDFPIIHDPGYNWRAIRYAKHLIVGNSSFSILPSLLNEDVKEILAPKFHAGYNKGYQQQKQNVYKRYTYLHHESL